MALAVESTGSGSAVAVNVTVSFTVTSANLLMVGVGIGTSNVDPIAEMSSVTWNGVAMTEVSSSRGTDGNFEGVAWYKMTSPATGTHNVVATILSGIAQLFVGIVSFTGASSTLGTPSTNSGTSANPSVTVADSANGDIVISIEANDEGGAVTAGGTSIGEIEGLNGDSTMSAQYQTASGANTACSWTESASGASWSSSGLAVKAATAGGGTHKTIDGLNESSLLNGLVG